MTEKSDLAHIDYVASYASVIRKAVASGGTVEVIGWSTLADALDVVCALARMASDDLPMDVEISDAPVISGIAR